MAGCFRNKISSLGRWQDLAPAPSFSSQETMNRSRGKELASLTFGTDLEPGAQHHGAKLRAQTRASSRRELKISKEGASSGAGECSYTSFLDSLILITPMIKISKTRR